MARTALNRLPNDLKHILQLGHPRLNQVALPVTESDRVSADWHEQKELLQHTLDLFRKINGFGRGIAAPQIDVPKRMVALNLKEKGRLVLINPEITDKSEETFTLWDDCMSFPFLMVKLRRHTSISLTFTDEQGYKQSWDRLPPNLSELLQHEIDHLDGILAVDRAIDLPNQRGIVSREYWLANKEELAKHVDYTIY